MGAKRSAVPRNSNRPWTPEEDERLLKLAAEDRSHIMIGLILKRSPHAVGSHLHVLRSRIKETEVEG